MKLYSALHAMNIKCSRYNLRSQVNAGLGSFPITTYFNVRKRRSNSSEEEITKLGLKRHCHRGANVVKLQNCSAEDLSSNDNDQGTRGVVCSPLGMFDMFPPELLQIILDFISLDSLSVMCTCSGALKREVRSYTISSLAQKRFTNEATNCTCMSKEKLDHFSNWGNLINAATDTCPLSSRLYILSKFYRKNIIVEHCAKGWGKLFYVIYKDLSYKARLEFMNKIFSMDNNSLHNLLDMVLRGPPGLFPNCEIKIRRLIRGFFLDISRYSNVNEVVFWMSAIVRTQKTSLNRARLLFLLYGPWQNVAAEEAVDWRILVDSAIRSYSESIGYLKPLSDALYFLASSKFLPETLEELNWNETEIFNIIEELTSCLVIFRKKSKAGDVLASPEPWCFDNFASLILHRPSLIPVTFVPRVMNGFVDEAGQLFNTMKTLLYRWGLNGVKHLGKYITFAMSAMPPLERYGFVAAVHRAFSNQLQDHLSAVPAAQLAFGEEIKAARSNSSLLKLIERYV